MSLWAHSLHLFSAVRGPRWAGTLGNHQSCVLMGLMFWQIATILQPELELVLHMCPALSPHPNALGLTRAFTTPAPPPGDCDLLFFFLFGFVPPIPAPSQSKHLFPDVVAEPSKVEAKSELIYLQQTCLSTVS